MYKTGADYTNQQSEASTTFSVDQLPEGSWKVRPCEWYKEEYSECKSVKGRFHQYFVYGESTNCIQWHTDYKNCLLFRNEDDLNALDRVIDSENERIKMRRKLKEENDIWEYRSNPPDNWNQSMPDWMVENKKQSHLQKCQVMLNEGVVPPNSYAGLCTIL